jgi:uncharacterized repeat protein (TIGR03847 family)
MKEFGLLDEMIAGALGEPGNRTFLIELRSTTERAWYLVEKRQVAALALEAAQLLEAAGFEGADAGPTGPELELPTEVAFRVGDIDLAYVEASGLVEIVLHPIDETRDEAVAFSVTPVQLDLMARTAAEAVAGGRPACPRCGLAMDPDGHHCPVDNGDLRDHRP